MVQDAARQVTEQARTRLARTAVVDAARGLFVERGYGATTIDAISAASGVPSPTVYRLFGSKLGILKALLDVAIVGDDVGIALADRPDVASRLSDPDPRQLLAGFVAIAAEVNARTAPSYGVLVSAADSDPHAAGLLAELTRQRHEGQGRVVRTLARRDALRPGVRQRDAADVVHALVSPEVYRLLVRDRGWRPERYQRWLTALLVDQLLPRPDHDARQDHGGDHAAGPKGSGT